MTDFQKVFEQTKHIVVVGISDKPDRDSGRIALRLVDAGFTVSGVHPILNDVFGIKVFSSVAACPQPIDIVDIFLSGDKLDGIKEDIVKANPKVVWFQLGVHNADVQKYFEEQGIEVITDHCIAVELRYYHPKV